MPPPNRAEVETEAGAVAAPGWTADERERIAVELATKLPPEAIASRPGQSGKEFSYMEFWRVVERSNQILGFDGWSSTIVDMNQEYMETRDGRTSCGYTVVVRVTLKCGTFHEDVGFGSMEKQTDRGKAIENAKKEAVSDATKRALKSFGHALGLSIYDTAHVQQLKRDGASKRARTATAGGADALRSADGPLPGLPLDPSLAAGCSNACGPPPQAVQHPQRTTGSHAAPGVAPSSTAPAQGAWQPRAMHASACGVASAPSCSASVHAQHASAQVSPTPQVHAAHGPSCAPPVAQASFQHTQPLGNLTNINVTTANPSGSPHALPSEPPSLGVEPAANHVEAIQRGWHAPRKV
ncbi:hypothetical protein KFE25_000094 [Diacronema lutheri]|uniref:Uncharacterized protein n=1 Tax=Diacronema lutheri TaxID=2081491 RepID=A0A8J6CAB7_DIALT|nr:hypothetical protein KFE25_000094 [Diacronema lutheri]